MKAIVWPADAGACGHYRMIWPVEAARAALGPQCGVEWAYGDELAFWWGPSLAGPTPAQYIGDDFRFDTVVTQRPLDRRKIAGVRLLAEQQQVRRLVVENDDAFAALRPGHPVWADVNPLLSPDRNYTHLAAAQAAADAVIVSTPALRPARARGTVHVLRNALPRHAIAHRPPGRSMGEVTIGWAGPMGVHVGDLAVTGGAVAKVLANNPHARFLHIGPPDDRIAVEFSLDRVRSTGLIPFARWHRSLDALDVAVAPLADTPFNRAKSFLKAMEAAGRGVACVASPTPEMVIAADNHWCVLAATPDEWADHLDRLVNDPAARHAAGQAAWESAREWTYERLWPLWWAAWTGETIAP